MVEKHGGWYRVRKGRWGTTGFTGGGRGGGERTFALEEEVGFQTAEGSHLQMSWVPRRVASREPELEAS